MTKVVVVSDGRSLLPRDPYSEEIIRSMPRGVDAMAELRQPRSLKQMRFIMAMAHKVASTHPTLVTVNQVIHELKIRSRMFDPFVGVNGKLYYALRSIAFETMDQTEFAQVWESWRRIIKEELLPGIDDAGLVREMMETL